MVHRQPLIRAVLALAATLAGALAVAAAGLPTAARAADAKVAIGHYRWSHPVVHVDLGQRVTWYWVGPDTMHSVTGVSSNDLNEDSDPHRAEPEHRLGDHFRLSFSEPGVYQFHCKLHPVVHGEVIDAEIWHADPTGRRTTYAGWQQWRAHIGFNELPFASRGRHFRPRPGGYVAYVKATDMYNNVSRTRTLRFTIR